jgi:hypothetical protein
MPNLIQITHTSAFTLLDPAAAAAAPRPVQYQDGWRCCQKCSGLFYGGFPDDQGHCPAGDKHDSTNSKDYMVPFGDPGPSMQSGWRWCQKCQGLFYAGDPIQGACPSGGQHEGSRSLPYDMTGVGSGQEAPAGMETGWRWCAKCEGLFNSGNQANACPTGEKHEEGSSKFVGTIAYVMKLGALPIAPAHKLKPQLFLVETYQLSTFHGGLILGDPVGTQASMGPHSKCTVKLITKKMTSQEITDSSTVLDDQTEQASQNFNNAVQDSSDSKSSSEHYDYGMQASFHGEAQMGFGGGSADANVQAAGSTNDVRQEVSQSVGHAVDSQVSQANQKRKQEVTVDTTGKQSADSTETEVDSEQTNDSDQTLNLEVFQLKQELVTILSLVDVQVAFRNGDTNANKMFKLFELDSLLEEVIAAAKDRVVIKSRIKSVLDDIRDYMDESKSILVQDPTRPDILAVNKRLTSAYELKNRDGTTRKVLSVPGIIINAYPPRFIFLRGSYMVQPLT